MPTLPIAKRIPRASDLVLIGVLSLIILVYFLGVVQTPFHPDENTYLYMSADWELWITDPAALFFDPNDLSARQRYRLLDAPLGRYLIGISRSAAGYSPPTADWNWALTWKENEQAGALPAPGLLTAGRLGPAALFPFSLVLITLSGYRLGGRFLGWSSMLLLASNALVLLHTRRAMSEGGLVFTICLFIASLVFCRKRPWLIGIPAALMVCAKYSTLPLVLIGMLAVILYRNKPFQWKPLIGKFSLFAVVFLAVLALLNPILWTDPFHVLQAAVEARQNLLLRQTGEFGLAQPEGVLSTPWKAALSMIANLFITPPAIADIGNYLAETNHSAQQYLAVPIHYLFRDLYSGGLMFALCLLGFSLSIKNALPKKSFDRPVWILLASAGLIQFLALILTVTLPFQRYVVPLVPFTCVWAGYCLSFLIEKTRSKWINRAPVSR